MRRGHPVREDARVSPTIVFFHAHPDDEALLTAGTMARANAEGRRVVLVTATDGAAGLASIEMKAGGLGPRRLAELARSARILGVARVEILGYSDSGLHGDAKSEAAPTFCSVPVDEVATRLTSILAEERATTLVIYDRQGGYGHPDHKHVYRCGLAAGESAGVPRIFAATAPREPFAWGVRAAGAIVSFPPDFDPGQFTGAFTPHRQITHRLDVRDYIDFKRAAMRAHASQSTGGDVRTLAALLRLPKPIFRVVLGTEYYRRLR